MLPDNQPKLALKPNFERMLEIHPQHMEPASESHQSYDKLTWQAPHTVPGLTAKKLYLPHANK